MEITDVSISLIEEGQIRAFASLTFDRCFTVRDVQLLETPHGYLIRMPTVKRQTHVYGDGFPAKCENAEDDRGQGNLGIQESDCRKSTWWKLQVTDGSVPATRLC